MRFLLWLAALGALGYAFFTVPIGGKTGAEHASEVIRWDRAREKAAVAVVAASERVKAKVGEPERPAGKGERPPAHKVDEAERKDLERLVQERTRSR
jgi:hypothetical protein